MNKDRIISEVKLHIETAREFDINRYISTGLTELNRVGVAAFATVTVDTATGTYVADPAARTDAIDFNYYPLLKCLLLPTNVISVTGIYYNASTTPLNKETLDNYLAGLMKDSSYAITENKEIYLSFAPVDGDTFKVKGRYAVRNLELLSDKFEDWLVHHILTGLYLDPKYKDADQFAVANAKRQKAWNAVRYTTISKGEYIAKDGLL